MVHSKIDFIYHYTVMKLTFFRKICQISKVGIFEKNVNFESIFEKNVNFKKLSMVHEDIINRGQ